MRAIRAHHFSHGHWEEVFQDITGMSDEDLEQFYPDSHYSWTDSLTKLRENLAAAGYEDEVKKADARHLAEGRGDDSPENFERRYRLYYECMGTEWFMYPPYTPEDAI